MIVCIIEDGLDDLGSWGVFEPLTTHKVEDVCAFRVDVDFAYTEDIVTYCEVVVVP